MTKILVFGDIVARPGRRALEESLPALREKYKPDFVVINGENSAGGFGITKKVFKEFTEKLKVNCITTGNHWADKSEIHDFHKDSPALLIPANMYNVKSINDGYSVLRASNGESIAVINLIGNVFMKGSNASFFDTADQILAKIPGGVKTILVDFHAEATSEKQALAHYLKDRVSLVWGTHTHCQTADERIMGAKMGYISDVGMTGAYDSVIGIKAQAAIHRMKTGERKNFEPAKADPWVCAIFVNIDDSTGNCVSIERLRLSN